MAGLVRLRLIQECVYGCVWLNSFSPILNQIIFQKAFEGKASVRIWVSG